MGGGMAANLARAGHAVASFDLSEAALERAPASGCAVAVSAAPAITQAEVVVIAMLPTGSHVRQVYAEAILTSVPNGALLIDCSTIDVDSALSRAWRRMPACGL
jgi:3-hydroxyisobutyrate dehydrogenase